jgi:hypothetical protein
MLDKIKNILIDIQNSSHVPAFVKITGYFNVDTVEFRYDVNSISCNPKETNIIKAKNIFLDIKTS